MSDDTKPASGLRRGTGTPRTDDVVNHAASRKTAMGGWVDGHFARALERQLAQEKDRALQLCAIADQNATEQATIISALRQTIAELTRERDEARADRAAWKKQLQVEMQVRFDMEAITEERDALRAEVEGRRGDKAIVDWLEEWASCVTYGKPNSISDYHLYHVSRAALDAAQGGAT